MNQSNKANSSTESTQPITLNATYDRIVKEAERKKITSISRSQAFQLERKNQFPKRVRLSKMSVGWRLSELLAWVESRQTV